jgi:hypothetical protein
LEPSPTGNPQGFRFPIEQNRHRLTPFLRWAMKVGHSFFEVIEVRFTHPARHSRKLNFGVWRSFDRIHADTLLARVAPLLFHIAGRSGGWSHHQDQELYRIDRFRDLVPPADAAFEDDTILLDDDVGGVASQPVAELPSANFAVHAGIRDEHSRHQG